MTRSIKPCRVTEQETAFAMRNAVLHVPPPSVLGTAVPLASNDWRRVPSVMLSRGRFESNGFADDAPTDSVVGRPDTGRNGPSLEFITFHHVGISARAGFSQWREATRRRVALAGFDGIRIAMHRSSKGHAHAASCARLVPRLVKALVIPALLKQMGCFRPPSLLANLVAVRGRRPKFEVATSCHVCRGTCHASMSLLANRCLSRFTRVPSACRR